jgi:hypothetical protein
VAEVTADEIALLRNRSSAGLYRTQVLYPKKSSTAAEACNSKAAFLNDGDTGKPGVTADVKL